MSEIKYEASSICHDPRGPLGLGWERVPGMTDTWRRDQRWAQGHGFVCADTDDFDSFTRPTATRLTPDDAVAEWLSDPDLVDAWRESQDSPVADDALADVLYVGRVVPTTYLDDAEPLSRTTSCRRDCCTRGSRTMGTESRSGDGRLMELGGGNEASLHDARQGHSHVL